MVTATLLRYSASQKERFGTCGGVRCLTKLLIDTLIVLGMFVLRIGLPVAILFLFARWVGQKLQPQEMREAAASQWGCENHSFHPAD